MRLNPDEWIEHIGDEPMPVLAHSIKQLAGIATDSDVSVTKLAQIIRHDPGLAIELVRIAGRRSSSRLSAEITSAQQAIMMLGTEQVRNLLETLPTLEKTLKGPAQNRLLHTYSRAYHAATQAMDWAVQRHDMTPEEVFISTLMQFIGEIILSIHAPQQLEQIDQLREEKNLAVDKAQNMLLGFTLDDLSILLAQNWSLPKLVLDVLRTQDTQSSPRVCGIKLAVQLIRDAEISWYDEHCQDTIRKIAKWLNDPVEKLPTRLHLLAVEVARSSEIYQIRPLAAQLPLLPRLKSIGPARHQTPQTTQHNEQPKSTEVKSKNLNPKKQVIEAVLMKLARPNNEVTTPDQVIDLVLHGMHDGIGLNRVTFAMLSQNHKYLEINAVRGIENDSAFNHFQIKLDTPHLFVRLLKKPQALWINDSNRMRFWPMVPVEFRTLIHINTFFAMSLHINKKPLGIFYADRYKNTANQLDVLSYKGFKALCLQTAQAMERLSKIQE